MVVGSAASGTGRSALTLSRGGRPYSGRVRFFVVIPILAAVAAGVCVLWPPARRFIWPAVTLAAINVVLTPFSSGEWFYQHREDAAYQKAVARGDFTAFRDLLAGHDPRLLPRMIAIAVGLLLVLIMFAVLRVRAARGRPAPPATSAIVGGAVLLAAAATLVQGYLLIS